MLYTSIRSKRRISGGLLALAAVSALALSACSSQTSQSEEPAASASFDQALHDALPQTVQDSGVLRLGSPTTNAPFITKPADKVEGLIPDLAAAVGERLGVSVEFVDTPFPGLVPALESGRVDALWTVMNDTVEREQTLELVDWIRTDSGFLVIKGNPLDLQVIEDFCGNTAGTLRGSAQAELLEKTSAECVAAGKPGIEIKLYDDMGSGQTQLRSGNLDGYLGGTVPLKYLASQVDNGDAFEVMVTTYLGGVFGIAVPKGETAFAEALVAALQQVEADGTYADILDRYAAESGALANDEFQINGIGAGAFA